MAKHKRKWYLKALAAQLYYRLSRESYKNDILNVRCRIDDDEKYHFVITVPQEALDRDEIYFRYDVHAWAKLTLHRVGKNDGFRITLQSPESVAVNISEKVRGK